MNALLPLESFDVWHVAGWTMLHFLWLGALVGLAAGVCRMLLWRASANLRYATALACLTLLVVSPLGIAALLVDNYHRSSSVFQEVGVDAATGRPILHRVVVPPPWLRQSARAADKNLTATASASGATGSASADTEVSKPVADSPNLQQLAASFTQSAAGYLPWLWLIGTPLTFVLLATGIVGAERLRRTSRMIDDGPITEACARLVESLRIGRRVTIAVCERIAAPVLVGIVRPIILLPPAALTGWSPDEIEMVLLHELAHVRRWDNLVNLLQRMVESLLFFHPAVWLVSSWVRREREACCDAVVVGRTNRPHAYAEMLVEFATRLSEPSEPGRPRPRFSAAVTSAMAAGPLRGRIRHILGLQDDPMLISGKSLAVVMSALLLAATLVVLNLPTLTQAEESTNEIAEGSETTDASDRDAGEARAATQNNLKNLMLAIHNYEAATHYLPTRARFDAHGKPLLSWRVLVLPYLGENEARLYSEFRLNEPWDSVHNRKLIARMPEVFKNPQIAQPGMTNYLAVVGKECVFDIEDKPMEFKHVTDGTENTIAIVEANANQAVEWTKPQDWEFDREQPTAGLGSLWPGLWYAAWVDGSINWIDNGKPADEIGIQFTRAGGETKSLNESAGQHGLDSGELGIGGAKPATKPVDALRAKFIPSDTNRFETRVYDITDAPNVKLRLDWIVEMLKRDPSEPRPSFGYNWTNDWTRLEIIAPREGQKFVEPLIKATQQTPPADAFDAGEANAQIDSSFVGVAFVVGASRFEDGDNIAITDIRGTSGIFETGNVYQIKGTYTLASRDSARLSAFTTAKNSAEGTSPIEPMQTITIQRGSGEFTLTLPMTVRGWPHVSFYPAEGGPSFGGIYFGTGDSVLEKWWGPNEVTDTTSAATESANRRGKFPSLEDQKLADVAYRRLGLELEAIGDLDLKRVRALGYDGGLKITQNNGSVISWETRRGGILPNDILVGLHVWPMKNFKDVLDILQRDDLAELNPLKFYIVRPQVDGTNPVHDALITGRISVSPEKPAVTNPGSAAAKATEPPRVVAATPMPIPLGSMKSPATDAPADEQIDQALASDPYLEMMNQELMSLQYELNALGSVMKSGRSKESDRLKALIADKRRAIDQYRRTLREQPRRIPKSEGLRIPTIPNAVAPGSRISEAPPTLYRIEVDPKEIAIDPNLQGPKPERWLPPPALAAPAPDPLTDREKQLLKAAGGVRIEFYYHSHSDPCTKAAKLIPIYEKEFAGLVKVERINVAEHPAAAKAADVDRVPTFKLYLGDRFVLDRTGEMSVEQLDYALASIARHEAMQPLYVPGDAGPPKLRYEGRTFDQWQAAWKTELSTERRLEAVKALAAFGANGYGKEAAEAIVDIAGHYDWDIMGSRDKRASPIWQLRATCVDAFNGQYDILAGQIPKSAALDVLLANVGSKNASVRRFVAITLPSYRYDPRVAVALAQLFHDDDKLVQRQSIYGMARGWLQQPPEVNQPIVESLQAALRSNDRMVQQYALEVLIKEELVPNDASQSDGGAGLQLAIEIEPLLFSKDSGIQSLARQVIHISSSQDARPVVDRLVKILDDPKSTKRLAATRALRALGPKAATALPQLNRMLEQPNDIQLRVAAALAIDAIEDGQRAQSMLNSLIWNGLDATSKKQLSELYNAELNVH